MAVISGPRPIQDILNDADSLSSQGSASDPASFKRIIDQYEKDGTYLTREMLQLLVYAMYGPDAHVPENARVFHFVDSSFSLRGPFEPLSLLYRQTQFIVNYLEDPNRGNGGKQLIEGFIIAIRRTPDIWFASVPARDEFNRAWDLVSLAVHFRPIKPLEGSKTFREHFDKAFPRPETTQDPLDFDINLEDILAVNITIITTDYKEEHLEMEGDKLKILAITSFNVWGLRHYKRNKAAQSLGIHTLGEEILYTCHVLYGKDQLYRAAEALDLLNLNTEITKTFGPKVLADAQAKPFVLSERTRKLRKEIDRRRAWLPTLIRDIKKQSRAQPFLFYGGILAIFFGVLQTVQTITSIWSLVLAIQAQ